jgi:hypothetical protein
VTGAREGGRGPQYIPRLHVTEEYIYLLGVTEEYTFIFIDTDEYSDIYSSINIYSLVMNVCSSVITDEHVCVSYSGWKKFRRELEMQWSTQIL